MDYEMASFFIFQFVGGFVVFAAIQTLFFFGRKSIFIKMLPLLSLISILAITIPVFGLYLILFTIPVIESCIIVSIAAVLAEYFVTIHDEEKGRKKRKRLLLLGLSLLLFYVLLRSFLWVKTFSY